MKTRDLTGHKLGEYQITAKLGRGATADVYKALQPKLNRYVGIKVLSPLAANEGAFRERFVREARAVAQLDHPNILPVYDFDQQGNLVYIVMQYVDAGSLADMLADLEGKPLSLDFTLEILEQVGSALSHAHSRGVVHRDVKPDNILLGPDNWVLLTDFGLVKILGDSASITQSGTGVGTPNYMAPEQVQGDPVDPRADVYALGATLYQMVTGKVPFEGESGMAVALKHLNEPPTPPRALNPDLPLAVDQVIVKALAKDRGSRYQSADELVAAFREAVVQEAAIQEIPDELPDTSPSETEPPRQATLPRFQVAQARSTPDPISLAAVWPPEETREIPSHGGSGWGLLAALVGTLIGFSLLFWVLAVGLSALLEKLS